MIHRALQLGIGIDGFQGPHTRNIVFSKSILSYADTQLATYLQQSSCFHK